MSTVAQTEVEFSVSSKASDGSPTSCPTGQIRDSAGFCVPDKNPSPCAAGQERDAIGACIPVTGLDAKGKFVKISRPSTVTAGKKFTVTCYFKNIGNKNARFSIHIKIPQFLGLDTLSRFIKVSPNATGVISLILQAPTITGEGSVLVKGLLELMRSVASATDTNNLVIDHAVNFTFRVVKFTGVTS